MIDHMERLILKGGPTGGGGGMGTPATRARGLSIEYAKSGGLTSPKGSRSGLLQTPNKIGTGRGEGRHILKSPGGSKESITTPTLNGHNNSNIDKINSFEGDPFRDVTSNTNSDDEQIISTSINAVSTSIPTTSEPTGNDDILEDYFVQRQRNNSLLGTGEYNGVRRGGVGGGDDLSSSSSETSRKTGLTNRPSALSMRTSSLVSDGSTLSK